MNIKEHIDAGHYPKDDKGRSLVPMRRGGTFVVAATDKPGQRPIVGWHVSDGAGITDVLHADDISLLPPAPRKITNGPRWLLLNSQGGVNSSYKEAPAKAMITYDLTLVRLPDELEEYVPERNTRCCR